MSKNESAVRETSSPFETDATPCHPLGLNDMPEEILHEKTGYLLHAPHQTPVRHPQPLIKQCAKYYAAVLELQHRRDVIALSSCCKWTRRVVFGRCLPDVLNVKLCEKDLSIANGLMSEIRDVVTHLRIRTTFEPDEVPDSFIDFIRPFTNVRTVDIFWTPFTPSDPRLQGMKAALRTPQTRTKNTCQHLTNLDIRTVDTSDYEVSDSDKIEQLRYVLQQLRLSSVKILYLTLGHSNAIHAADSAKLWSSLIKAFKQCHFPKLENLRFDIRDMKMNGHAIGTDLCDALSNVFRNCFRFSFLKDISVVRYARGLPGDSYKLWSIVRTNDKDGVTCQAWLSPHSAIRRLIRSIKDGRPEVNRIHLQTEWSITRSDHAFGVGMWIVDHPVQSESGDESASEEGDQDNITLLPFDNDFTKVTVYDSNFHGACDEYLRANQAVNLRGRGRRGMRSGQRTRRTEPTRL